MKTNVTTLTSDSQKLLIETVRQLEKIISTNESARQGDATKRDGPLFFPKGIGHISIHVKIPGGEVTVTISEQPVAQQVSATLAE